jgi:uncharacterized protein (TIGR03435 family)
MRQTSQPGTFVERDTAMIATALGIVLKATVTTTLALAGVYVARRRRAAVRHVVLLAAFAALLVVPLASALAPVMPIEVAVPAPKVTAPAPAPVETVGALPIAAVQPHGLAMAEPAPVPPARISSSAVLFTIWAAGALLFLLPVAAGMWQVRALRRAATPWPAGRARVNARVDVLFNDEVPGPMTCGLIRPAVILPRDAVTWPAEDLNRALVHELEHVRRADWATQCFARAICALYWFHPLVWAAWRRLSLEAERACDDAVVVATSATEYADQLVELAGRLSKGAKVQALAMANRDDLAKRVMSVLDARQPRGRAGARLVGTVCVTATAIIALVAPLRMIAAPQAPAKPAKTFEVATIKPCDPASLPPRIGVLKTINTSENRLFLECITLASLVNIAYVRNGEFQVTEQGLDKDVRGGPAWMRDERWTIEATAKGEPTQVTMLGEMMRALIEERFQLRVHRATEDRAMYALTVAKDGLKIKPIAKGDCVEQESDTALPTAARGIAAPGGKPYCGMMRSTRRGPVRIWDLGGASIRFLADVLDVDREIVDQTGVTGNFNFHLEYVPDAGLSAGLDTSALPVTEPTGDNIFAALEKQLGLKLVSTKGPHSYVVIDRVERLSGK